MLYSYESVMKLLSEMSDEKRIMFNRKHGVTGEQFGNLLGNIRALGKKIKRDHALAKALWFSKNYDAMILGAMLFDSKEITHNDFEAFLAEAYIPNLVDELTFGALSESSLSNEFMKKWMKSDEDLRGRAGWNLAVNRVQSDSLPEAELEALVTDIEVNLVSAQPNKQWAMNHCLCKIGIHYDKWTDRCLEIGSRLGVYKEMKVSKGCTSAYAPEWIRVGRAKKPV